MNQQQLIKLTDEALNDINKLLADGFSMGQQLYVNKGNGVTEVYVILNKFIPVANANGIVYQPYINSY